MAETTTGSPALTIPGIEDLQPVARGGFGTVYQGWQPELRRKVAVKVLDARGTDPDAAARFRREGMAMGALSDHPNVVPVYSTGTVDDRLYLVMPYLPDGSLADQLASGPLPPEEVARLGRDLADALAAAHAAGVLHRDVKPANVLRTPYGALQLADFGVARFVDTTQTVGAAVMATVPYAAPEVLAGEAASEASDVYSLGATLHAALRGKAPYEAGPDEAAIAVAVRVLSADPPDLRADGVPAGLAEVIERAMARDPAQRHPSAADLRDALDAVDLGPATPAPSVVAAPPPAPAANLAPAPPAPEDPLADTTNVAVARAHVPEPDPASAPRGQEERRAWPSRAWGLLALLALLIGCGLAVMLLDGEDDDQGGGTAAPSTTVAPSTTEVVPPSTEAAAPTTPPTTASTTPPTTGSTSPGGAAATPEEAVRDYYALMDAGRIDEGFDRLSPAYQERTGEASYRRFWEAIAGVEVLEAASDGLVATSTLRYTRQDGSTSTERVTLRFVQGEAGALLIDDYRVG